MQNFFKLFHKFNSAFLIFIKTPYQNLQKLSKSSNKILFRQNKIVSCFPEVLKITSHVFISNHEELSVQV